MVSYHLQNLRYEVTTFSNHLDQFKNWLSGYTLSLQPTLDQINAFPHLFDAIFLQHDNSQKAKKICALKMPVYTFYSSHLVSKHGPIHPAQDFICQSDETMVQNLMYAMAKFFGSSDKKNGLIPPKGLIHRRHPKRIVIHPTSSSLEKNWPKEKFLKLKDTLKTRGYDPVFTVAPQELSEWEAPHLPTLDDLASFLYESGGFIGNDSATGHLASYLNIPYLVIGQDSTHLELWRPGWGPGLLVTPPQWLNSFKFVKSRWKHFISEKKVIKTFNQMGL
jgi:ADP-heptose:LPS heptosyltransferase